uniref:Uncharacterized protein n=1 Tax=Vespula pensylvanica TaxID=30213 RepID=A0A834P656_VESPE|nr:hypothetical protein H0235_006216 [Vespula pensylvanica]
MTVKTGFNIGTYTHARSETVVGDSEIWRVRRLVGRCEVKKEEGVRVRETLSVGPGKTYCPCFFLTPSNIKVNIAGNNSLSFTSPD